MVIPKVLAQNSGFDLQDSIVKLQVSEINNIIAMSVCIGPRHVCA